MIITKEIIKKTYLAGYVEGGIAKTIKSVKHNIEDMADDYAEQQMNYISQEDEKGKKLKNMFLIYFDGCYGIDSVENTSNTFTMGVCKLEYIENTLVVHLRRPGLLIGKGGSIIDALAKHLDCYIEIVEVNLLK